MGVVRKSSGTVMAYDPAARWSARAWALVAYLAVLAVVAGIVVFAVRYQPLTAANFASGPVTSSGANVVRVGYANGGTFSFGFLVVNDGPLPVKIQRIQVTGQNELLVTVGLETAAKRYAGQPRPGRSLPRQVPSFHVGRRAIAGGSWFGRASGTAVASRQAPPRRTRGSR